MTKPYSLDLRERVAERVAAGDSVRAVVAIFTVSVTSVVRWSQRVRRTGSVARGKMGGHRACTLIGEWGWLIERIATEPEVTVRRLRRNSPNAGLSSAMARSGISSIARE
jgi:transposase